MRRKFIVGLTFLAWLCAARGASADEIVLKDGTKITGTIVGFENDSFRVETSYGFALIRKDKVADITISGPPGAHDAKSNSTEPAAKPATGSPAVFPTVTRESMAAAGKAQGDAAPQPPVGKGVGQSSPAPSPSPAKNIGATEQAKPAAASAEAKPPSPTPLSSPSHSITIAGASGAGAKADPAASKAKSTATVSPTSTAAAASATQGPAAPAVAPAPPEPSVIHDEIRGNQYVNETYGFQMYRPPSWELIPAARKALPDAVAALGTSDQTTLLVIGRERAKGTLDSHSAATEKALGEVYEHYRVISSRRLSVAGSAAIEERSRGTADGRDWSVVLLTLLRGTDAYTLLGMTWADSDLIQVQENVIAKAVNSLTFNP